MLNTTTRDQAAAALGVAVILGSTREGRMGEPIAHWLVEQLIPREDLNVDLIDLAEAELPHVMPDFEARAEHPYVA